MEPSPSPIPTFIEPRQDLVSPRPTISRIAPPSPEHTDEIRVISPQMTANLRQANVSAVPDRQRRGVKNRLVNGEPPTIATRHHMEASDFDKLMLQQQDGESIEDYDSRLPKRFLKLRRFVTQRALLNHQQEQSETEEIEAAALWYGVDAAMKSRSPSGEISNSPVLNSLWFKRKMSETERNIREAVRHSKIPVSEASIQRELEAEARRLVTPTSKTTASLISTASRINSGRRTASIEARAAHNSYAGQMDKPGTRRKVREREKTMKFAHDEAHHAEHAEHQVVDHARVLAERIARKRQGEARERAKLEALDQAIERRDQQKAEKRAQRKARRQNHPDNNSPVEHESNSTAVSQLVLNELYGSSRPGVSAEILGQMYPEDVAELLVDDVLNYRDVLGSQALSGEELIRDNPNAWIYASKLAEIILSPDAVKFVETSRKIKQQYDELVELLGETGSLSNFADSTGWRMWDIAKQEVLKSEEYRSSTGELYSGSAIDNGDTDEGRQHTENMILYIVARHAAWEAHRKYALLQEDSSRIDSMIEDDTKNLLHKIGANNGGQLTSAEYTDLGLMLHRDAEKFKAEQAVRGSNGGNGTPTTNVPQTEVTPTTPEQVLESKSGNLVIAVKGKIFNDAEILRKGKINGEDTYLVEYTDGSGNRKQVKVSAESLKRRNIGNTSTSS